jgi:hypothetical protein
MKRKIIQIVDRFLSKDDEATLMALADDGTLWERVTYCCNEESYKVEWAAYRVDGKLPTPRREYKERWQQIEGLPDDNSNLTKRFP